MSTAPVRFTGEQGVFPRQWAKPDQGEIFIIPGLAWNAEPEGCIVENNVFVNSNVYQFDAVIGEDASGIRFRRNIISYGPSYISLEYALGYHGLIPERVSTVTSVALGRSGRPPGETRLRQRKTCEVPVC